MAKLKSHRNPTLDPVVTVSACSNIRDEWELYRKKCRRKGTWINNIEQAQAFLTEVLTDPKIPTPLRCASIFKVFTDETDWPSFADSSLITFCAITELFGILAERSGHLYVQQWKEQFQENINNGQTAGVSQDETLSRIRILLTESQSCYGSLSNERKFNICQGIAPVFWLHPDIVQLVQPLLPTHAAERIGALPFGLDNSLNQELVQQYMPDVFNFLDLYLSNGDWGNRKAIKHGLIHVLYKAPKKAANEQWDIPQDAFENNV